VAEFSQLNFCSVHVLQDLSQDKTPLARFSFIDDIGAAKDKPLLI
jgi:hypothetical protein